MVELSPKAPGGHERAEAVPPPRTSEILPIIAAAFADGRMTLGALLDRLGSRAFGLGILLLALPNVVPIPIPTGISTLTGVPLVLLCAQLLAGWPAPRLPGWLARRSLSREDFDLVVNTCLPGLRRVERWARPRWASLTGRTAYRVVGLVGLVLSAILALPIPGGNFPPAIALTAAALGLMERDGLLVAIGGTVAGISLAIVAAVIWGGALIVEWAIAHWDSLLAALGL